MTMANRCSPSSSAKLALTNEEINLLDNLVKNKNNKKPKNKNLSDNINKIAKLGGYLARASDPSPGNIAMWRVLSGLVDIELGFNLEMKIVGN